MSDANTDRVHWLPITLVIASAFCFTVMIVIPRFVPEDVSTLEIALIRFLSAWCLLMPVFVARRRTFTKPPMRKRIYVARSILAITMLSLSVYAIHNAPIVIVQTILMANGVFTIILGGLIARERLPMIAWLSILLIVCGGVVTIPEAGQDLTTLELNTDQVWGVFAAFLASIAWGGEVLMTRSIARYDHSLRLVTYVTFCGAVLILPIVLIDGLPALTISDIAILSGMGLFAALGQLCSATALAKITASAATPYRYSSVIFALALGYLVFGEIPNLNEWLGSALIIAGIFMATLSSYFPKMAASKNTS